MGSQAMLSRIEGVELSMEALKEIVARTSLQVEKTSAEMAEFKEEMREFKEEMRQFREDSKRENREFNRRLGEIANKHGRLIEDIVAPSICRVMKLALSMDEGTPCYANERIKRESVFDERKIREFDVVAKCGDYVMVNETKSSLRAQDVTDLIQTISVVREYFPEFQDRKIIGSIASVYVDDSVVNFATRNGVLALAVGDELMDIRNPKEFRPEVW